MIPRSTRPVHRSPSEPTTARTVAPITARTTRRLSRLAVTVALLLVVGLATACSPDDEPVELGARSDQNGYRGTYLDDLYRLPDVTFTDSSGDAYNLATTPSRPVTLVFFGYTHCPDICRAVLSNVAVSLDRSPATVRDKVQMIFVTTDPARDTPKVNAAYLERFDPTFIGLTGDLATIKSVAGAMGVDVGATTRLPSGGYDVSHSTPVIGFDKDGGAQVLWTEGTSTADMAADLALLVDRQS